MMIFKPAFSLCVLIFFAPAFSAAQSARDHGRVETGAANFEAAWESNPARLGWNEDYEIDALGFYQNSGALAGGTSAVIPGGESGGIGALIGGEFMRMDVGLGYGRAFSKSLCLGAFVIADRDNAAKEPSSKSLLGAGALYRLSEQLQLGAAAQGRSSGSGGSQMKLGAAWITPPLFGATELDAELLLSTQTLGRLAFEQALFNEAAALRAGAEYDGSAFVFSGGFGFRVGVFQADYGWRSGGAGGVHGLSVSWLPAKRAPAPIQAPPPPSLPLGMPEPPASEMMLSPTSEVDFDHK